MMFQQRRTRFGAVVGTMIVFQAIVPASYAFTFSPRSSSPTRTTRTTAQYPHDAASSSTALPSTTIDRLVGRVRQEKQEKEEIGIVPSIAARKSQITTAEVRSLFSLWNDALATGDSTIVAKRYSADPILLPTVSDTPRADYDSIKSYFDNFLTLKPQGVILEGKVKIGSNWAQDAGIYEFTMGLTGTKVRARYSFVYVYENGEWKISHHHSSTMPEASKEDKTKITEEEARNLFNLWSKATLSKAGKTTAKENEVSALFNLWNEGLGACKFALIGWMDW